MNVSMHNVKMGREVENANYYKEKKHKKNFRSTALSG